MRPRSSGLSAADEAHDAPVLRELLSVLLEARTHAEVHGAQLERVRAQLERLDARVATLERRPHHATPGAASSAARFQPSAAAWARSLTLMDLSVDVLDKVVTGLDPDDELAASLACRKLRDAIRPPAVLSSAVQQPRRPLETRVCSLLASLDKLQWGVESARAPMNEALFARVAGLGDLRMLSWLRARGCPWLHDSVWQYAHGPSAQAAAGGHLSLLQWLQANGCLWRYGVCAQAAAGGYLSVLQWLHANGCVLDRTTCAEAARGGHLDVLQWARANCSPWDEATCARAAEGGHLHVLRWARANGCKWDEGTCANAAHGGHLAQLQWARANGCPWGEYTCASAACGGHLSVLR
jgi:hypothetical protein